MNDRFRLIAAVSLFAVVIAFIFWDFLFWRGRFPPNCYIEKIDVSCLSKREALKKLYSANVDEAAKWPVTLVVQGERVRFRPSQLGIYISPKRTIINATSTIYRSNYIKDIVRRATNNYPKRVVPLSLRVNRDLYREFLTIVTAEINVPVKDAAFVLAADKTFKITKEVPGRKADIGASLAALEKALWKNERSAEIVVATIEPRVRASVLVRYPPKYLLSEYTTYYGSHDSKNRVHNIKLASSRTNNYIICSGETFSLLDALGDFSRESGYKEAFIIYNDELEPQYGGGSCQIASTIYNAALLAGLEIVERHNHGIYFTIYPLGRDASIYSGGKDLKFRNNTSHPIYVKAFASDRKLTYRIYGTPTAKKVSFSRPMVFFEGERFHFYDISTNEAKEKIGRALLSGKPFSTYIKVVQSQAGVSTQYPLFSSYKMTGDRENVRIVRPEPD